MITDQLRDALGQSDLSNYRLARLCELDTSQLSKFRSAGRGLSLGSAARLADVLGLQLKRKESEEIDAEATHHRRIPRAPYKGA